MKKLVFISCLLTTAFSFPTPQSSERTYDWPNEDSEQLEAEKNESECIEKCISRGELAPVCGSDHKPYYNLCAFFCAKNRVKDLSYSSIDDCTELGLEHLLIHQDVIHSYPGFQDLVVNKNSLSSEEQGVSVNGNNKPESKSDSSLKSLEDIPKNIWSALYSLGKANEQLLLASNKRQSVIKKLDEIALRLKNNRVPGSQRNNREILFGKPVLSWDEKISSGNDENKEDESATEQHNIDNNQDDQYKPDSRAEPTVIALDSSSTSENDLDTFDILSSEQESDTAETLTTQRESDTSETLANQEESVSSETLTSRKKYKTSESLATQQESDISKTLNNQEESDTLEKLTTQQESDTSETLTNQEESDISKTVTNQEESDTSETFTIQGESDTLEKLTTQQESDTSETLTTQKESDTSESLTTQQESDISKTVTNQEESDTSETLTIQDESDTSETLTSPEESDGTTSIIMEHELSTEANSSTETDIPNAVDVESTTKSINRLSDSNELFTSSDDMNPNVLKTDDLIEGSMHEMGDSPSIEENKNEKGVPTSTMKIEEILDSTLTDTLDEIIHDIDEITQNISTDEFVSSSSTNIPITTNEGIENEEHSTDYFTTMDFGDTKSADTEVSKETTLTTTTEPSVESVSTKNISSTISNRGEATTSHKKFTPPLNYIFIPHPVPEDKNEYHSIIYPENTDYIHNLFVGDNSLIQDSSYPQDSNDSFRILDV